MIRPLIKIADSISALAFTSVCVSAHIYSAGQKVYYCVKNGGGVTIFLTLQSGLCPLFVAFCQIKSFGNYWSDEAVGAAGRVKDSVIRH